MIGSSAEKLADLVVLIRFSNTPVAKKLAIAFYLRGGEEIGHRTCVLISLCELRVAREKF